MIIGSPDHAIAQQYHQPILCALMLHTALTLLALFVLDGGVLAKAFAGGSLGFWIGVGLMAYRRPFCPVPSDLLAIRWGLIPVFIASVMIAELAMSG